MVGWLDWVVLGLGNLGLVAASFLFSFFFFFRMVVAR